ncbi:rRNA maturation RNase YbeY [Aromatoleum evansii]|uniref:Endoribonuclease YbeY n=1 Tax=Aromatoleum evansii TaxID=59406 RepID=A0ABZ1AQ37_AROEV|nr:rRNA maturation RNase YbeY [Aromatoleum evansii]NMG30520.1 rRNA maturation RNase YbeY [Aromatoleum evansii]WRL47121.1 rRNA maturation RNase YbeY [Aromatoleum evansii]
MIDSPPHLALTIQKAIGKANRDNAPSSTDMRRWAQAALQGVDAEVTVRLVGATEGRELNRDFRGKDYATNVLTFVYGEGEGMPDQDDDAPLAGDLVLCVPVVVREAAEQGKPLAAHYAHLIVHGMLHLQGYDHEDSDEAEEMEALETRILAELGYPDPYAERSA